MYKKSKLRTLIIIFFILLLIVWVVRFLDKYKGDKIFKREILKLDTSALTVIRIFNKAEQFKEIELYRSGKGWNVKFEHNDWDCDPNAIKSILLQLADIKTDHIAGTDQSNWKTFGVNQDEGVRVKLEENNKPEAHFIVGRMSYSQPSNPYSGGSVNTYIRLLNIKDDKVYAVNGYLDMLFNRKVDNFRKGLVTNFNVNNIIRLTYIYPNDSSFALIRKGNQWLIDDIPVETESIMNYLKSISHLNCNEFADDYNVEMFTKPLCSLKIDGTHEYASSEIRAFPPIGTMKHVMTSSENPNIKFKGDNNNLFKNVFIGKRKFLKKS